MSFLGGSEMPNHSQWVVLSDTGEVQTSFLPVISSGQSVAPKTGE